MIFQNCNLALQLTSQSLSNCGAVWTGSMGGATSAMHLQITAGALTGNLQSPWGSGSSVNLPSTNSDSQMQANLAAVSVSASTLANTIIISGTGAHVSYSGKIPFQGRLLAEKINKQLNLTSGNDVYLNQWATTFAEASTALAKHSHLSESHKLPALEKT
jgi:hypothetical protein